MDYKEQPFLFVVMLFAALLCIIGVLILIYSGITITAHFKLKYKYYCVTEQKIRNSGFSHEYFENGIDDACYRLLIKQILSDFDKSGEYRQLMLRKRINDKYAPG
jgi:hypothetical protein